MITVTYFSDAAQRRGVASTLSLPLLTDGHGAGGVNLYGASSGCFDGHHEELAQILDAWGGGAVTDADLSFATRAAARNAPRILRESATVDVTVGALAATLDLGVAQARERLANAAQRAGLSDVVVAELVKEVMGNRR